MDREAALAWIHAHGRDLERALVGHAWRNGSIDAVIAALEAYRCPDGGYGRGLEPDAGQRCSSVIDTCAALAVHRRIGTPDDHPALRAAVAWLAGHDDRWPLVMAADDTGSRAPWFCGDEAALAARFRHWAINPRAEVLGLLLEYGQGLPRRRLAQLEGEVIAALDRHRDELEMHELIALASLRRSRGCSRRLARSLDERLRAVLPAAFDGAEPYHLRPHMLIEGPGDPVDGVIEAQVLRADLRALAGEQHADGAWRPVWRWEGAGWGAAERAWASHLTERALRLCAML